MTGLIIWLYQEGKEQEKRNSGQRQDEGRSCDAPEISS